MDVTLLVSTAGKTSQHQLRAGRTTIGRGEEAALCLNDQGLSRLHASIHREGDHIWLLDEGSTNGSYVNGEPAAASGAILKDGDQITLGNETTISISFGQPKAARPQPAKATASGSSSSGGTRTPLIAISMLALMLLAGGGVWAFSGWFSSNPERDSQTGSAEPSPEPDDPATPTPDFTPSPLPSAGSLTPPSLPPVTPSLLPGPNTPPNPPPAAGTGSRAAGAFKLYREMTPLEREAYVYEQARRISASVGNRPCTFDEPLIRKRIVNFVDSYAKRVGNKVEKGWGADLNIVTARGIANAPLIIRSFDAEGISPLVGLYIAMIETEFQNICNENPAGAAGMFQFLAATARGYGLTPADRCNVEKLAPAAAKYMRERISEFGGDATSVGLAIAGYNRSPASVRRDLHTVLNSQDKERSFWTLVLNDQKLDHYFQENLKYVPKFFAAAIVGENPEVFGLRMKPLSTYTQAAK
ncbi:MAG: FHA domain-containing protein [Blastocatellia bacterium]